MTRTLVRDLDVATLVARRTPGYSLEAPFYTSSEIYDVDLDLIFGRHWIFVAAEAEIPEEGDYLTVDVGAQSVIVLRDDDCEVRAFRNICRHRGARLLDAGCGSVGNIVCPYHQWTYGTDGSLRFAEEQAEPFDKSQFGLRAVHAKTVAGLVYICLADEPPVDFDDVVAMIEPFLLPFDAKNAKVAHQTETIEDGNWKLVMENNRECHHCEANHPELTSAYFPFNRFAAHEVPVRQRPLFDRFQTAAAALDATCELASFPRGDRRELDTRVSGFQIQHLPLDGVGASYGSNGESLCSVLVSDRVDVKFGDFSLHTQPNAWFHFLGDHVTVFSALPVGVDKTLVRTTWLVHQDAVEGVDYNVDDLTLVWRSTNDEDRSLVERTQRGVTDPGYLPGRYSTVENDVESFVSWYIGRLAALLPGAN
ncbi:aromatic ring-hydroxylating dioxygenase subunit alpha [Gordonia sp. TBRC 11910]|uniref:Aromatic ring-hydroxylating dioxygenase subunit alpha n=1 Tax=Gordonia asplenii TaxID=2725283 RepID=A0A848L246_9ACTN|nr:aromatic ring-hydroxylating dioxygenase subunit alpha [Gordonia asplenii]NMO01728.1 aromatic ring-hydroxylating dioxygenase subunit alpha [Gordonia asplenii]